MDIDCSIKERIDLILSEIERCGYVIIQDFISQDIVKLIKEEYAYCMENEPLHAQAEKFDPVNLEISPWRKLAVGSRSGNGEPYSQLLLTTYFSQKDKKYPILSEIFKKMISLRNLITDMPLEYGNCLCKDPFWNACRIHHYPLGGGHMAAHRDTLFPSLLNEFKIPFIQMMVTLSNRGNDFSKGGGYICDKNGTRIFFERFNNAGSMVLFDGSIIHGVDDIDPAELLDISKINGRMALFVNLYRNLGIHKTI